MRRPASVVLAVLLSAPLLPRQASADTACVVPISGRCTLRASADTTALVAGGGFEVTVRDKLDVQGDLTVTGSPTFGSAVAIGDLDGDGLPDLAIGEPGTEATSGAVHVARYGADGAVVWARLTPPETPGVSNAGMAYGSSLAIGDVDRDGNPDLIVGAPGGGGGAGGVFVHTFTSDGWHLLKAFDKNDGTRGLGSSLAIVGDLDGDGTDEVAAGAPGSSSIDLLSTRSGQIRRVLASEPERMGASLAAADLDGDGALDLVAGAPRALDGAGAVYVFGSGPRQSVSLDGSFALGSRVAIADLDGDGRPDIVALSRGSGTVTTFLQSRVGQYDPLVLDLNGDGRALAVGDVDGDGRPDIVVSTSSGWAMQTAYGREDADASGDIAVEEEGVSEIALADLNGDGRADVTTGAPEPASVQSYLTNTRTFVPTTPGVYTFELRVSDTITSSGGAAAVVCDPCTSS